MAQARRESDRPGDIGKFRLLLMEHLLYLRRHLDQGAALHRSHNNYMLAMPYHGLVAGFGLDRIVVPVKVVELKLDIFHLRAGGQNAVQYLRTVMGRKTQI